MEERLRRIETLSDSDSESEKPRNPKKARPATVIKKRDINRLMSAKDTENVESADDLKKAKDKKIDHISCRI